MPEDRPPLFARPTLAEDPTRAAFRKAGGLLPPPAIGERSIFAGAYSTADAAIICGIDSSTLAKLIRRYGPISDTREAPLPGKSAQWCLMDVFCFRLAIDLIRLGLPPAAVFWLIRDAFSDVGFSIRALIGKLLIDRKVFPSLVGFHTGGTPERPKDYLSAIFLNEAQTIGGMWTEVQRRSQSTLRILDLNDVIDNVLFATGSEVISRDPEPPRKKK